MMIQSTSDIFKAFNDDMNRRRERVKARKARLAELHAQTLEAHTSFMQALEDWRQAIVSNHDEHMKLEDAELDALDGQVAEKVSAPIFEPDLIAANLRQGK